jgi:hypothetical protein
MISLISSYINPLYEPLVSNFYLIHIELYFLSILILANKYSKNPQILFRILNLYLLYIHKD